MGVRVWRLHRALKLLLFIYIFVSFSVTSNSSHIWFHILVSSAKYRSVKPSAALLRQYLMFFWYKWTALVYFLSFNYHSQHSLSLRVCVCVRLRELDRMFIIIPQVRSVCISLIASPCTWFFFSFYCLSSSSCLMMPNSRPRCPVWFLRTSVCARNYSSELQVWRAAF